MSSDESDAVLKTKNTSTTFELPKVSLGEHVLDPDLALSNAHLWPFSAGKLAAGLMCGCSARAIKAYLQAYPRETVTQELKTRVHSHRAITYAIERNDPECLRAVIEYGAKPRTKDFGDVPLLAFAIMRTKYRTRNATEIVKVLLIHGADVRCIPQDMWIEYVKTPTAATDYKPSQPSIAKRIKWCTPERRAILAETLNLTMRYYIWKAHRMKPHTGRTLQIAAAHRVTDLLKLPFQIIGQEPATTLILRSVFTHVANNIRKPLVMAFAGLSGHGKTECATQMGQLLSTHSIELDCAQMGQIETLLGPNSPYRGYEDGSPFNNFVSEHGGKRCVVFLDEFDKVDQEIRNALLKVMDTGIYRDRRSNLEVDTSKVIWILATNAGDRAIDRFHTKHIADRKDADIDKISIEPLRQELFDLFVSLFTPAIAGRINVIAPFFPFSPNEQAAVAHKFYLEMQDDKRKAIDLEEPQLAFIAHADLSIADDGKLCQHVAKRGYVPQLGARSIYNSLFTMLCDFTAVYCAEKATIEEALNSQPYEKYTIQLHPESETVDSIAVFRDGHTANSS